MKSYFVVIGPMGETGAKYFTKKLNRDKKHLKLGRVAHCGCGIVINTNAETLACPSCGILIGTEPILK